MSFTAKDVAKLRAMTSVGMMACKKALTETDGDMDAAVAFLRQKGMASAAKKAGNVAAEGMIATKVSADNKTAAIVEVNSQTDFAAKNEEFIQFVSDVATAALTNKTNKIEDLVKADLNGRSVADAAIELTAKIGEKIDVRRVALVEGDLVSSYVHPVGSKVGVIVSLSGDANTEKATDVAMHVAAANPAPEFIATDEIPADIIAKEKEIESNKDDLKGKPPEIIEKIVGGRVGKFFAARVLNEQGFIKDPNQKISEYLGSAKVVSFSRFNLGEGVEKKEEDYAAEVAAAMKV